MFSSTSHLIWVACDKNIIVFGYHNVTHDFSNEIYVATAGNVMSPPKYAPRVGTAVSCVVSIMVGDQRN